MNTISNNFKYALRNTIIHTSTFEELTEHNRVVNDKMNELFEATPDTLNWAAKNGYIGVCKWLTKQHKDLNFLRHINSALATPLQYAAEHGHLEMVKWLYYNAKDIVEYLTPDYFDENSQAISFAARSGNIEIIDWLFENTKLHPEDALAWAAQGGHIEIVKKLYNYNVENDDRCIYLISTALSLACQRNHIEIIKYLYDLHPDIELPISSVHMAVQNGHIDVVKWLYKHHKKLFEECETLKIAAYNNQILVTRWLYWNTKIPSKYEVNRIVELCKQQGNLFIAGWLQRRNTYYYRLIRMFIF